MDEATVADTAEAAASGKRVRFWHRVRVVSKRMILLGLTLVVLRLFHVAVMGGKSEPGLLARCLGMAALTSFIVGTFLADLWVLHALVGGQEPAPPGTTARKLSPVSSLLLTGRLRSTETDGIKRDILFAKALLVLFATLVSVLLLVLLWTHK